MIIAVPAATPRTTPFRSTTAIASSLLDQTTWRPVSGVPSGARGVAVNCWVAHTLMLADAGSTSTDSTLPPTPLRLNPVISPLTELACGSAVAPGISCH